MESSLYYFFVFLGTIIFCLGLVLLLRKPFYNLATTAVKQLDIILDRSIGESEKDQYILRNLFTILKYLSINICILFILIICSILPVYLYKDKQLSLVSDTSSVYFYTCLFLGSISLLFFKKKTDYTYWSKLLHTIVLDNYNLGRFLFELEIKVFHKSNVLSEKPFVIVTGLARGGTTALTNLLYDKAIFHSITYANVPFLLAPNFWKKIYKPLSSKKKVRAHDDKVLFSENSIEALEEYFFKAFLKDSYIKERHLEKHEINKDILLKYYKYQDLFRDNNDTIYLAKNNNFLLRYESILKFNKQFKLVLIFRKPIEHAQSLLRQHENFLAQQEEDNFILKYMNWLGHYEFGQNQKYFSFDNDKLLENYDKSDLSYWLAIWINYYSEVTKIVDKHRICLVNYDDFLENPAKIKKALEISLEMKLTKEAPEQFSPQKYTSENLSKIDVALLEKANNIYEELILQKLDIH